MQYWIWRRSVTLHACGQPEGLGVCTAMDILVISSQPIIQSSAFGKVLHGTYFIKVWKLVSYYTIFIHDILHGWWSARSECVQVAAKNLASSTGFYNTHGAQAIDLGAMAFPNLKGPGFKCPKHHWNQGIKSVQIYHDWNCRRILLAFFSPLEQCLRPLTSLASRFIILFANGLIWASWPQDTMYTCQDQVHPQLLLLFLILRIEYWTTVTFWIFLPRLRSL